MWTQHHPITTADYWWTLNHRTNSEWCKGKLIEITEALSTTIWIFFTRPSFQKTSLCTAVCAPDQCGALQRTLPMSKSSVQSVNPWAVFRTTKFSMRTNPISTLFSSCIPQCKAPRRSEIEMADRENNGCFSPLSHRRSACIPAEGFLRAPLPQTELQEPCCVFSLIFVRNFASESFEMIEILR